MSVTKKEYFDVWERVKSKFYQDTQLLAVSKNMERLALEINKSYGEIIVRPNYMKNKLKLLDNDYFPHAKMPINKSIFNAMKQYGDSLDNTNASNKKEYIGRIDIIEGWTKTLEIPSAPDEKKELDPKSVLDDDTDAIKLKDIVGADTYITTNSTEIAEEEELITLPTLDENKSIVNQSTLIEEEKLAADDDIETSIFPVVEQLPKIPPKVSLLEELTNHETPEIVPIEEKESTVYTKGLLLVSIIALFFLGVVAYEQFSTFYPAAKQEVPSYLEEVPTAESTIENFFAHINKKDYKQAFELTDNELWNPYTKFIKSDVWGGFEELSQPAMLKKNYSSKFGADEIVEVSFYAFDIIKQKNVFLKYDFHLAKRERGFIIVRMIYSR